MWTDPLRDERSPLIAWQKSAEGIVGSPVNRALKQVRRNKGAPGIDGMTVDELPDYLRQHWPEIRQQLLQQTYRPKPVRRVTIPNANGGFRPLGIPTVLDRFIQQAIAQVIQQDWEPRFHPHSYGFRPGRSAHQAVRYGQHCAREGRYWVVDLDLEAFFDRVNHDRMVARLKRHTPDRPGCVGAMDCRNWQCGNGLNQVTESPWYVIRMPGDVGGGAS